MKAFHLLSVAESILQSVTSGSLLVPGEGGCPECRTVINRSYYSAYNGVVEFLGTIGYVPGKADNNHAVLQQAFSGTNDPRINAKMRTISNKLATLSSERKKADYDLRDPRPESKNQATLAIALAKDLLKTIDEMATATPEERDLVASALHHYFAIKQTPAFIRRSGSSSG